MAWAVIFSAAALLVVFAFYITRNREGDAELDRQIALGGSATEQPFGDAPRADWVPDNLKTSVHHVRKDAA